MQQLVPAHAAVSRAFSFKQLNEFTKYDEIISKIVKTYFLTLLERIDAIKNMLLFLGRFCY